MAHLDPQKQPKKKKEKKKEQTPALVRPNCLISRPQSPHHLSWPADRLIYYPAHMESQSGFVFPPPPPPPYFLTNQHSSCTSLRNTHENWLDSTRLIELLPRKKRKSYRMRQAQWPTTRLVVSQQGNFYLFKKKSFFSFLCGFFPYGAIHVTLKRMKISQSPPPPRTQRGIMAVYPFMTHTREAEIQKVCPFFFLSSQPHSNSTFYSVRWFAFILEQSS